MRNAGAIDVNRTEGKRDKTLRPLYLGQTFNIRSHRVRGLTAGPCVSNTGIRACTALRVRPPLFNIPPARPVSYRDGDPLRADVPLTRCRTRTGLANGLQSHAKVLGSEFETCLNLR